MITCKVNKKGDLRDNMVSIIIGVLCLVLIVIFAVTLYNVYADQEAQNAKKALSSITGKIDLLKDGQNNIFLFPGFKTAKGWIIMGWDQEVTNPELKPDKCLSKSCLCICPDTGKITLGDIFNLDDLSVKYKNSCQDNGFCKNYDIKSIKTTTYYVGGKMNPPWIHLNNSAIGIKIIKEKDVITLESNYIK